MNVIFEIGITESPEVESITIELDEATPLTKANFLNYCNNGFFEGTTFHRVISGFVVQGGGFTQNMQQKPTEAPIENEAEYGASNLRGSVAMARTQDPHSATSQFFINLSDNTFLDQASSQDGWGYCVFGRVSNDSMEVFDAIAEMETTTKEGHQDVPVEDFIIKKVTVVETNEVLDTTNQQHADTEAQDEYPLAEDMPAFDEDLPTEILEDRDGLEESLASKQASAEEDAKNAQTEDVKTSKETA